jgi:hypothetical protein
MPFQNPSSVSRAQSKNCPVFAKRPLPFVRSKDWTSALSLPGEFGDLPHAAIRRTPGGLQGEFLITAELLFTQDYTGWIALEFLAWWVRDLSRSGHIVQMRTAGASACGLWHAVGTDLEICHRIFSGLF